MTRFNVDLRDETLPNIREVFSEVHREESRKKFTMGSQNHQPTAKSFALAARGSQYQQLDNRQRRQGRPLVLSLQKPEHSKETCWKIHGKLAD